MSIKVELSDVAGHVEERGAGFLMTTGPDGRPHTTHVTFTLDGSKLRAPIGRKTVRNVQDQSLVALLWPARSADDYNLIIDGTAAVVDVNDEGLGFASIEATHAILHRNVEA